MKILSRKVFHDYAIPIFATLLFVLLFAGLCISRQYALAGVSNLASTNPLIVSDTNKLVSRDDSGTMVSKLEDEVTAAKPTPSSSSSSPIQSTTPAPSAPGTQKPAGSSTSPVSGGSATQPSTPAVPQPQFSVSLSSIQDKTKTTFKRGLLGIIIGCSVDHEFKITVDAVNGPGVVKYKWVRSVGGGSDLEQKTFTQGSSSIDLVHKWTTSSSGDYWVSLVVTAPTSMEKKYSFKHQC